MSSPTRLDLTGLRQRQLTLLDRLDELCRREGLTYYLWGGTLLGALKFGGYIPWDDDLDVTMPREDYERLLALPDERLPSGTTLLSTRRSADYHLPYTKLGLLGTLLVDHGSHLDLPVNIDVHPLDDDSSAPGGRLRRRVQWLVLQGLSSSMGPLGSGWRRPVRRLARQLVRGVSRHRLSATVDRLAARRTPGSPHVSVAVWHNRAEMRREWFGTPVDIDYEGRRCLSPQHPREVLAALYGPDWTEMPPDEQQVTHHDFEAFELTD